MDSQGGQRNDRTYRFFEIAYGEQVTDVTDVTGVTVKTYNTVPLIP